MAQNQPAELLSTATSEEMLDDSASRSSRAGRRTKEQLVYMNSYWTSYLHNQSAGTLDRFWPLVYDGWYKTWPIETPTPANIKECGSVSAAKLLLHSENNLVRATSYYPCTIGHLFIPLVRGFAPGSTTRVVRAPKPLNPICTSTKTTNENWPLLKLIVLTPGIPVSGRLLSPVGRRKNSLVCPMMGSQPPSPS